MYIVVPDGGSIRFMEQTFASCDTVAEALEQATSYLAMGFRSTSIRTQDGRKIDGTDLAACCRGDKILNDDLTVAER